MKVCRKVLSIILAVVLALGTFAVAASANGNPDTATYQSTWWLTASKATINWTGDSRVSINDSGDEQTGLIEVEPGDTYYVYLYVTNNYYTGNMSTHVFYSADLLDCTDIYLKQRPNKTSMTQANVNKVFLWNSGDNVEYLSACSASNSVRGAWGNFVDSVKADDICWPQDANGNVTLDKSAWKFTRIGNQPDPGVSEETFELWDDSQFLVKFPLTIPEDAADGTEYTVMIPEGIIRDSNHKFAWMYLNNYPDGTVPAPSGNPQYYDEDQYFDLSGATLTFKVPGETVTLDYSALQTLYNQVKDTNTNGYTATSVAAFNTALQNAAAMLNAQNAADQAAIDTMTANLRSAYQGLTASGADYNALDNALTAAADLKETDYTAASWENLANAVSAGNAVPRNLTAADQATIDAAAQAITNAIAALEAKADYTALDAAIASAGTYNSAYYTDASWSALQTAVAAGNAVDRNLGTSGQTTINNATAAINNAIVNLVEKDADYTALDAAIGQADALNSADYTPASWANLADALSAAKAVARNLKVKDQATIDTAKTNLTNAIAALEGLSYADYTALRAEIANTSAILASDNYTDASWSNYQTVLAQAQAMADAANLPSSEQATVNKMTEDLVAAKAALTLKDADYSAVDTAIGTIPSDLSVYTDDTAAAVVAARDAVIRGKKITEQDTVNGYATAINNAVAALQYKAADKSALVAAITKADAVDASLYTEESYGAMATALAAAKALNDNTELNITNQGEIDDATTALINAYDALVALGADYRELNTQIAAFEALTEANYTNLSWANAQVAYEAAKAVPTNLSKSDQAQIDEAAQNLATAIAALIEADADYTAVNNAKNTVPSEANRFRYTDESLARVDAAVAAVVEGLKKKDQATVDGFATAINDAVAALEYKPFDYTTIDGYVDTFNALNADDYTPASYAAAQAEFADIDRNLTMEPTSYAAGMLKQSKLKRALDNLVLAADADYSQVDAAISAAEALVEQQYTADSWAALQDAINAVVRGLNANHQAEVDEMAADIYDAIDALVEVQVAGADYTGLDAAITAAEALDSTRYTADSWANLASKVAAGKALSRDLLETEQATVDAAAQAINDAIAALVEVELADYGPLYDALEAASNLDQNDYTEASWAVLVAAVQDAMKVPENLPATRQSVIDAAAKAIMDAIAALVPKTVKSSVTAVDYTPALDDVNEYNATVNGRASKVRFVGPDGGTMTFDRYSDKVSIKSYDAEGKECSSLSRNLAYEVWTISAKIADGTEVDVVAKMGSTWENESYTFTATKAEEPEKDYTLYSAELEYTEGDANTVTATVTTGLDVTKIRFTMKDGGSVTLDAAKYATENSGKLVFTYDVYTGFAGENAITLEVKAGSTWVDGATLTYNHVEVAAN